MKRTEKTLFIKRIELELELEVEVEPKLELKLKMKSYRKSRQNVHVGRPQDRRQSTGRLGETVEGVGGRFKSVYF